MTNHPEFDEPVEETPEIEIDLGQLDDAEDTEAPEQELNLDFGDDIADEADKIELNFGDDEEEAERAEKRPHPFPHASIAGDGALAGRR